MKIKLRQKQSKSFPPLMVKVGKQDLFLESRTDQITEAQKTEQESLLKKWQYSVQQQFKRQNEQVLQHIQDNYSSRMFVIKFYNKFVKRPKLTEEEGDKMRELVGNYLSNA